MIIEANRFGRILIEFQMELKFIVKYPIYKGIPLHFSGPTLYPLGNHGWFCRAEERANLLVDVDVTKFEIREKCECNKIIDYWISLIFLRVTIPSTIAVCCTFPVPFKRHGRLFPGFIIYKINLYGIHCCKTDQNKGMNKLS